jgi:glycine dehydrogenase
MVIELTGMETNASLDESTAAAEAMAYCLMFVKRSKESNVNKFFVSEEILPQTYFYKLVLHLFEN